MKRHYPHIFRPDQRGPQPIEIEQRLPGVTPRVLVFVVTSMFILLIGALALWGWIHNH